MEFDLNMLGQVLVRRKWRVIVPVVLGVLLAIGINTWTVPVYRATARLEIPREPSRSLLTGQMIDNSSFQSDNVALFTAAELITNREIVGRAVTLLRSRGVLTRRDPAERQVTWLLGRMHVEPVKDTRLVNLHVEHYSPRTAEAIANAVSEQFVDYRRQQRQGGTSNVSAYLTVQIDQLKERIRQGEGVLSESNQGGLYASQEKLKQLTVALGELRTNLVVSNTELVKGREIYKDRHPKLLVMESENASIQQNIASTEAEIRRINAQIRQYSVVEGELAANRELYGTLLGKLRENEIQGEMAAPAVQIVDRAVSGQSPVRPREGLNIAVCAGAGLLIGLGLALLREFGRRTIRTPRDVEEHLQLPVLGLIPKAS